MVKATDPAPVSLATIRPVEAAHFGKMAADWWNPRGSSGPLHRLNPLRLRFIRDAADRHYGLAGHDRRPLAGKRALDVGCGAGLLTEPLSRLGAEVTGLDASPEAIAVARAHAEAGGLSIRYTAGEIAALPDSGFDIITCLEVLEHVEQPGVFIAELARRLSPTGLIILSTPNRTLLSRLAIVTLGESVGGIPRGTHDWSRFLTPEEVIAMAGDARLRLVARQGIVLDPVKGLRLGHSETVNYLLAFAPVAAADTPA